MSDQIDKNLTTERERESTNSFLWIALKRFKAL